MIMANISGNFNTEAEEIAVVKEYLRRLNVPFRDVYKYGDANAGDVMVRLYNNMYSLFEVKQESATRISHYGDLGIDFISSLVFKDDKDMDKWKGVHPPELFDNFIDVIDYHDGNFKWGKIAYSYSDVWLFYAMHDDGTYMFLEGYSGHKMESADFFDYLRRNCQFAVNNKPQTQLSHIDTWGSATFFVNKSKMDVFRVNTIQDLYHNPNSTLNTTFPVALTPKQKMDIVKSEIIRTHTRESDVLHALNIKTYDEIDIVPEDLYNMVLSKLNSRPTYRKN